MPTARALTIGVSLIVLNAACHSTSGPHAPTFGTIDGTVTSTRGDSIAGAQIVVTPAGATASPSAVTSSAGAYSVSNVPVDAGHGTVSATHLPSYCATSASASYSNLTSGKSDTVNLQVPCAFSMKGTVLWINDQSGAVSGLSAGQLTASGSPTPTGLTPGGYSYAVAFDTHGNLWVGTSKPNGSAPATTYLYEYTPAQLTTAGANVAPTVAITLPALGGSFNQTGYQPTSIAFDRHGTLWVTSFDSNILYGFSASQLTATGAPVPAYSVIPASPASLGGIAFDPAGNLWLAMGLSAPHLNEIIAISAAQLSTGGTVTPIDSIQLGYGPSPTSGITGASQLAFDPSGNLWAAGDNSSVVMFTSAQLATLSASTLTLTPTATAKAPAEPSAVAFDGLGNLWVATTVNVPNPATQLLRFPKAALQAGGTLSPDITVSAGRDNLNNYLSEALGMAFTPGNGEPLNGSSVARRSGASIR